MRQLSKCMTLLLCIFKILSKTSSIILLPLYVQSYEDKTFDKQSNPYFVTLISTTFFCIFYGIFQIYKKIKNNNNFFPQFKSFLIIFIMGICFGFLELLYIYTGPSARVPVDLRGILTQTAIPISLVCSFLIKHEKLKKNQIIGSLIIISGIIISFTPIFVSIHQNDHSYTFYNIIWCFILIITLIFSVLINISLDIFFKKYEEIDIGLLLFWSSLFQLIIILLFFWVDIIPLFGLSHTFEMWKNSIIYGFECTFTNKFNWCHKTIWLCLSYCLNNVFDSMISGLVLRHTTANIYIILTAFISPLSVTFWILFPSLSSENISPLTIIMDYVAILIVIVGVCFYVKPSKSEPSYQPIET